MTVIISPLKGLALAKVIISNRLKDEGVEAGRHNDRAVVLAALAAGMTFVNTIASVVSLFKSKEPEPVKKEGVTQFNLNIINDSKFNVVIGETSIKSKKNTDIKIVAASPISLPGSTVTTRMEGDPYTMGDIKNIAAQRIYLTTTIGGYDMHINIQLNGIYWYLHDLYTYHNGNVRTTPRDISSSANEMRGFEITQMLDEKILIYMTDVVQIDTRRTTMNLVISSTR